MDEIITYWNYKLNAAWHEKNNIHHGFSLFGTAFANIKSKYPAENIDEIYKH
ncbi:MAG TPA: hypothetical protein VGG71_06720 [Chitinophagaceae bacterium]|jgi:hypothetical protein